MLEVIAWFQSDHFTRVAHGPMMIWINGTIDKSANTADSTDSTAARCPDNSMNRVRHWIYGQAVQSMKSNTDNETKKRTKKEQQLAEVAPPRYLPHVFSYTELGFVCLQFSPILYTLGVI